MNKQHLEFAAADRIEEYLAGVLEKKQVPFEVTTAFGRTEFVFEGGKNLKNELISGIVLNFHKFRILTKNLKKQGSDRAYYALLGALIGLERETEQKFIAERLASSDVINVDGFFNFCLDELRINWLNLAALGEKLYRKCRDEDDVYALAVFMLGMDESVGSTVVIDREMLYWEKNGTEIDLVPYYGDREADFIVTLLSHRPSDVVLGDPTGLPSGVLTVIRALGE